MCDLVSRIITCPILFKDLLVCVKCILNTSAIKIKKETTKKNRAYIQGAYGRIKKHKIIKSIYCHRENNRFTKYCHKKTWRTEE